MSESVSRIEANKALISDLKNHPLAPVNVAARVIDLIINPDQYDGRATELLAADLSKLELIDHPILDANDQLKQDIKSHPLTRDQNSFLAHASAVALRAARHQFVRELIGYTQYMGDMHTGDYERAMINIEHGARAHLGKKGDIDIQNPIFLRELLNKDEKYETIHRIFELAEHGYVTSPNSFQDLINTYIDPPKPTNSIEAVSFILHLAKDYLLREEYIKISRKGR
jgi:hypothetical protein